VSTKKIREFSTLRVSSVLRHSTSDRCVITANEVCRFLDIFGKNIVKFDDTFSIRESVQIDYLYSVYVRFHMFLLFSVLCVYLSP
jgi:hypothetical protein